MSMYLQRLLKIAPLIVLATSNVNAALKESTSLGSATGSAPEEVLPYLERRQVSSSDSWNPEKHAKDDRAYQGPWRWQQHNMNHQGMEATSRHEAVIPAFQDSTGLVWGPYELHPDKFQLKWYPLDMEELRHLYAPDGTMPTTIDEPTPREVYRMQVRPVTFRPEPELLSNIRSAIWRPLTAEHISAKPVDPQQKFFLEGMYLWPPLQMTASHLQMPREVLENRIAIVPGNRFRTKPNRNLYHFKVQTSEGERHILMTPVTTRIWIDTEREQGDSHLWIFFEGRKLRKSVSSLNGKELQEKIKGKKTLSFVGTMFLPGSAPESLLRSGVIKEFAPR